jgi:cyclase
MHRSLIVAKIDPEAEDTVAGIWAQSDTTELPHLVGVRRRSLYRLGDLYVHLLETEDRGPEAIERGRRHPEFQRISRRLDPFITPYLPTWRSPADAQARCFYDWAPQQSRSLG